MRALTLRLARCRRKWAGIGLILVLCLARPVTAGSGDGIDADIYRENDSLMVWIDLSGQISSERVELLREGVDLALECRVDLLRSRRLWGNVRIDRAGTAIIVGYHLLAEEYFLKGSGNSGDDHEHRFATLVGLHHFLADSVVVSLASVDSLDSDRRYFVELTVDCIFLTSLNLDSPNGSSETPLKFLFRHFLSLTGYGREQSVVSSDPFRLADIRSGR